MKMDMNSWLNDLRAPGRKRAVPVLSFPSIGLMGITVKELIGSSELQAGGMQRIAEMTNAGAAFSMMDLSVEAEAFGSSVHVSDDEVPTVVGAIVTSLEDAEALAVPPVGTGRTGLYVQAVAEASRRITDRPVFAGVIGSFSLAGRLMGVTDILINCYEEPEMVHATMEKATRFLIAYMQAYRDAGANGVVIAEPLTGLLSPDLAEQFSEPYLRRAIAAVQTPDFPVIYHNCGNNTPLMTGSLLRLGAAAYHFGNAIDMQTMLEKMPPDVIVMGNVDPAGQLLNGTAASVREATLALMRACCPGHPNFVISSGCDIPPKTPWENIAAFFDAVDAYYSAAE